MCIIARDSRGAGALGHSVHLLDENSEGTVVLQGVGLDRGCGSRSVLQFGKAKLRLHLLGEILGHGEPRGRSGLVVQAHSLGVGKHSRLHKLSYPLLEARVSLTGSLNLVSNLLPHTRYPKEQGWLHGTQTMTHSSCLEVVRTCERNRGVSVRLCRQIHWRNYVHHHTSNMAKRKVGDDTFLASSSDSTILDGAHSDSGVKENVIMANHHSFWATSGSRSVNERAAVTRLNLRLAFLKVFHFGFLSHIGELLPADNRHLTVLPFKLLGTLITCSPSHDVLQVRKLIQRIESFSIKIFSGLQTLELSFVLEDEHGSFGMLHLEYHILH
mmetsp:Transcript_14934/g.17889  ORF Transcript_14934/g.17889 Transcript_14934/m.17889 type:complete len:327 (+) Transcript_14934:1068-2048(+)